MVEAKCLVTLDQDSISSELIVANSKSSAAIEMSGSFISHLKVSTPDATYAVGLQGSNYHSKKPISSEFSIIPPSASTRRGYSDSLSTPNEKEEEGEEDDDYAHMTEKMSRIYTSAPRQFTIIDRVIITHLDLHWLLAFKLDLGYFFCDDSGKKKLSCDTEEWIGRGIHVQSRIRAWLVW